MLVAYLWLLVLNINEIFWLGELLCLVLRTCVCLLLDCVMVVDFVGEAVGILGVLVRFWLGVVCVVPVGLVYY